MACNLLFIASFLRKIRMYVLPVNFILNIFDENSFDCHTLFSFNCIEYFISTSCHTSISVKCCCYECLHYRENHLVSVCLEKLWQHTDCIVTEFVL